MCCYNVFNVYTCWRTSSRPVPEKSDVRHWVSRVHIHTHATSSNTHTSDNKCKTYYDAHPKPKSALYMLSLTETSTASKVHVPFHYIFISYTSFRHINIFLYQLPTRFHSKMTLDVHLICDTAFIYRFNSVPLFLRRILLFCHVGGVWGIVYRKRNVSRRFTIF